MISLKPAHLARYKDLVALLVRHGRRDLFRSEALTPLVDGTDAAAVPAEAETLAKDLEAMGPTYVKLGQLLSSRSDILPRPYLEALARLQDDVEPFPFDEVESTIREELGVSLSRAFERFDSEPLAAASLGQVHRAQLRGGRQVVVKVQRPGVRGRITADLDVLADLADLLDRHTEIGGTLGLTDVVKEFRSSLLRELDYRTEADSLSAMRRDLAEFDQLVVPRPVVDFTAQRVLTMDYVPGTNIGALSPVVMTDVDGDGLVEALFRAYLNQVLVNGFFHADPHTGNLLLTPDHRLAVIDLGMVGTIPEPMRVILLRMLIAISEARGDAVADLGMQLASRCPEDLDQSRYAREVNALVMDNHQSELRELNLGLMILDITRVAARHGMRLPPEITLLGKTLLNLDEVARILAPGFEPAAAIRTYATELLDRHLRSDLSLGALLQPLMQSKELMMALPGRMNQLSENLADNRFEVHLKNDRIDSLIVGFQKVANRITSGLILAALILGAALLMRVETKWTLFGYPALAVLCFLLAAGGGFVLLWTIYQEDRTSR